jgi:hypothetical protein
MNPFFPITADINPNDPSWWIWLTSIIVLLLNIALWFVAALVIGAGIHLGWLLV